MHAERPKGQMMSQARMILRERPGALLAIYLALAWLPFIIDRLQGDAQDAPLRRGLATFAVLAFLAWRIRRGGTISWALLVLGSVWNLVAIIFGALAPWTFAIYRQTASAAIQLALLLSPAIRRRLAKSAHQYGLRTSSAA